MKKITLEGTNGVKVVAQFNPKELSFTKTVEYSDGDGGQGLNSGKPQFTSGKAIDLSLDLLFDNYETGKDVRATITALMSFALVAKDQKNPPEVTVTWGDSNVLFTGGTYRGVVTSLTTTYTMFSEDGIPVRATAKITFKQIDKNAIDDSSLSSYKSDVKTVTIKTATEFTAHSDRAAILEDNPSFIEEDPSSYPATLTYQKR